MKYNGYTSRITKRGLSMNELDLTNTQAFFLLLVIGLIFLYLHHLEKYKPSYNKQAKETPRGELNPCYGRYIQLAGINKQGDIK